jgi:hypothetical protein
MFCSECGAKNVDQAKFCISCGRPLQQQPASVDQPPPIPVQQQYPPMPPPPPLPVQGVVTKRVSKMNSTLYIVVAAGGLLLGVLLTLWGSVDSKVDELLYFSWLPLVPALIALYVMVYKMWAAIQDGHARMTPGKAVGFLFIPLFNIYWFYHVYYGWAKDYNTYVARHALNVPKVSEGTFLTYVISSYFCFPVSIVMLFIVIKAVCNSVNALSR